MSIKLEDMSDYAKNLVKELHLEAHPEGGWYARDWQAAQLYSANNSTDASANASANATNTQVDENSAASAPRPLASLIYFLLPAGDSSAWHKVDADEIWLWHGPANLTIELGGCSQNPCAEADLQRFTLGNTKDGNDLLTRGHLVIPAGTWQRTVPSNADVLVSCVVSPGFTFSGFNLANQND
ncbi:cupin domain-containing protein [Gardnerella piotii]|nr:cupin [Bifidobacteriaceae bacterium NR026]